MSELAGVILAAGKGSRFQLEDKNKTSLLLGGKPIISYGVELLERLDIPIFVVVGFGKESVKSALSGYDVTFVEQERQLGTGNALASVFPKLASDVEHVLVINGDDPFHKEDTIDDLIATHEAANAAVTFATIRLPNPTGVGRVVRAEGGNEEVIGIIEEKDADIKQKKIQEVNGACYLFSREFLKEYLPKLKQSNAAQEYYITDLIGLAVAGGEKVETVKITDKWQGINTPEDLKEAEKLL